MAAFSILLDKYLNETLNSSEFEQFRLLLKKSENQELFKKSIEGAIENPQFIDLAAHVDDRAIFNNISNSINIAPIQATQRTMYLRKWGWAAAAIIFLFAAGAAFLVWSDQHQQTTVAATKKTDFDVAPGSSGATLTLSDGSQILLDSLENELVAEENGTEVLFQNGQLIYNPLSTSASDLIYNTVSTPNGRQFQMTLPDGTRVWLNSGSSIHYPTVFKGETRKVDITGEVYLEVAQNAKMPFIINANNTAEVKVLGTHLNVNAYDNEKTVNTTLLEGSVAVAPFPSSKQIDYKTSPILRPGQQAQVANKNELLREGIGNRVSNSNNEPQITVVNTDTEKVVAWKNGTFDFEGSTLEDAMRQLERWYDIEVRYEKQIPSIRFIGKIKKNIPLSGMLKILDKSGVHFRLEEERVLIVMP